MKIERILRSSQMHCLKRMSPAVKLLHPTSSSELLLINMSSHTHYGDSQLGRSVIITQGGGDGGGFNRFTARQPLPSFSAAVYTI